MGTFLSFRVYNTDNQPMIDTGASEIRLNSINPPSIANNSINDDIKKIYVPETSLEKYKSAPIWQNFSDRIVPIETY